MKVLSVTPASVIYSTCTQAHIRVSEVFLYRDDPKKWQPIERTNNAKMCMQQHNYHTHLIVVMHKTLCSVWLTFIQRENNSRWCLIVLKNSLIGKYGSTSYIGMTRKKMTANRIGIGPTTLKRACNSTTNTRTSIYW